MLDIRLQDLHLTAMNMWIRNTEHRLRTNKNANGTEMTDEERRWWQQKLREKYKTFRRACKKYGRADEYEHFLEMKAEREREREREEHLYDYDNE